MLKISEGMFSETHFLLFFILFIKHVQKVQIFIF